MATHHPHLLLLRSACGINYLVKQTTYLKWQKIQLTIHWRVDTQRPWMPVDWWRIAYKQLLRLQAIMNKMYFLMFIIVCTSLQGTFLQIQSHMWPNLPKPILEWLHNNNEFATHYPFKSIQTKTNFSPKCLNANKITIQVCTTANSSSVCFYAGLLWALSDIYEWFGWSLHDCTCRQVTS